MSDTNHHVTIWIKGKEEPVKYVGKEFLVSQQAAFLVVQFSMNGKDYRHLYPTVDVEQVKESREMKHAENSMPTTGLQTT